MALGANNENGKKNCMLFHNKTPWHKKGSLSRTLALEAKIASHERKKEILSKRE